MFWRFGGYAQLSSLDSILDKPDVTVEELLDESDLIQELKQQNSKLIEYLRDENVLERLLRYVIATRQGANTEEDAAGEGGGEGGGPNRPSFFGKVAGRARSSSTAKSEDGEESKEERQRMKYAYVSCEILSSEVWSISEAVLENQDTLRQFWAYIKQPAPLDPVQAGYFTKVNESLLDRKMEEMLDFFRSLDNVVPDMLQHVDCPVIMDLLLKIISLEKNEGGQGMVDVCCDAEVEESQANTRVVATAAESCPASDILSRPEPVDLHPDLGRRFPQSHNHHTRPVRHRAQRADTPARVRVLSQAVN
jgi:SIT4-associating protein SAP185/190